MAGEVRAIRGEDGLLLIGEAEDVERFVEAQGWRARMLDSAAIARLAGLAATGLHGGAALAAGSGRWVQLTAESAQKVTEMGLSISSTSGNATGVFRNAAGEIAGYAEFVPDPSMLANPAVLGGAAGVMAQVALQQAMSELRDYLDVIDAKLDDLLRRQKDDILADLIGAGLLIAEACAIRDQVGHVSDITWSKLQSAPMVLAHGRAYATRQIEHLTDQVRDADSFSAQSDAVKAAQDEMREWLAVLAQTILLQDSLSVLEIERVLDAAPEDAPQHRRALQAVRESQIASVSALLDRAADTMHAAAQHANDVVLLHPRTAPGIVTSANHMVADVALLRGKLGLDAADSSIEARRWAAAAADLRDAAVERGADQLETVRRFGGAAGNRVQGAARSLRAAARRREARELPRGDFERPD